MAAPVLPPRLALLHRLLHRLVRRQGGEWTRARVERAYAKHGYDEPEHTQRADLEALHQQGVLIPHYQPGRQYYTPADHQTNARGTA